MKYNKKVREWIDETKKAYNALKRIPMKDLKIIGNQAGLHMGHYKTKKMIAKGLMIRLTSGMIPIEFNTWK